jgi:hypothetical protein
MSKLPIEATFDKPHRRPSLPNTKESWTRKDGTRARDPSKQHHGDDDEPSHGIQPPRNNTRRGTMTSPSPPIGKSEDKEEEGGGDGGWLRFAPLIAYQK